MNKKLNLQWISNVINDDYLKWILGDTVLIESPTNTGKTTFILDKLIDNLEDNEKMIYICNRRELKRQIKIDLLRKNNLPIPKDIEEIDKLHTIGNVVIMSYQSISEYILKHMYQSEDYQLQLFKYIVCDECHYFFTDSPFNPQTHLAFTELIKTQYPNSIKILISGTMDEMIKPIEKLTTGTLHKYTTGKDYSFLNVKYFKDIMNIVRLIQNDTTNDKWLIFVANKKKGKLIRSCLNKRKITNTFITSESTNKERINISQHSRFESKVLIATKCLDNGVSIKDDAVKHVVITAYDKTTFLQEVGRVRIDIENARPINLYIDTLLKKSFIWRLGKLHKKEEIVNTYMTDYNKFAQQFDHNVGKVPQELFYLNQDSEEQKKWKLNILAYSKLKKDILFNEKMIEEYDSLGELAYINVQLAWLELQDTFNKDSLIEYVKDDNEVETMQDYLEGITGKKLFEKDQEELSSLIINELVTIKPNVDYRTTIFKPSTLETLIREELELPYVVSKSKPETKGKMRNKRYIVISKIN